MGDSPRFEPGAGAARMVLIGCEKTYVVVALPDHIVAQPEATWAKRPEELQVKQPRLLLLPVLFLAAVAFGQQRPGGAPADMLYARPGQLVDAGGFRLNLYCMGSGSPTVVFDSGWGDWAPAWSKVQPEVAKWTRACSYDRAGAGFSDPGPMPRTSVRIAEELHTVLHNAGIAGPYILVGSAFGGDNVRTFADLYVSEVAGLILDDADADDLVPTALQEEDHRNEAAFIPDLLRCRNLIAAHKALPLLPSSTSRPPQTCAQRFFFRGLPEAEWSPGLNARLAQIANTKVAMYDADRSEMEEVPADELYLQRHRRSLGSRPIRVLTSGNHGVGHLDRRPADTPKHLEYEKENTRAQARWLALSADSRQIFARHSSEYIQFDQPATVITAIREVHDLAKKSAAAPDPPASSRVPDKTFRDCRECPEMILVEAGHFIMGSAAAEKSWAASHGTTAGSVADEAPQHEVSVPSFALGKYDVTRGEYAAFVRETGHSAGDGCARDSYTWRMLLELSWKNPGFAQSDRDPVVCVSWRDAKAYIAWLNGKVSRDSSASGDRAYMLPSESEWEYAARAGASTRFWWATRERNPADFRDAYMGFRVARTLP